MKKILTINLLILSLLSLTISPTSAAQPTPKDPRTKKLINANIINFTNKVNKISSDGFLLKYSEKKKISLYKSAWLTARKNGVVVRPILDATQVASGLNSNSYGIYEFTELSMKTLSKVKYCLMDNKYELSSNYRSELWVALSLYPLDCDSLREYIFSLPDFKISTQTDKTNDSQTITNK